MRAQSFTIVLQTGVKIVLLSFLFVVGFTEAQEKQVIQQNQQWLEYSAQLKTGNKSLILVDSGYRWMDNYITGNVYYIRAGFEYKLSDNVSVHAGFAHLGYFYDNDKLSRIEHRPYQEMSIQNKFWNIGVYQRLRVEERFFEPLASDQAGSFNWFNWRFRCMIMFDIPLFKFSQKNPDFRMSLGIGDEIMINAGKNIIHNQFDQNRFLISPTFYFSKKLNVSFIWSNQFSSTFTPNRFIHGQVFWLQIRQKIDLQKAP